jgi:hypothetical protein
MELSRKIRLRIFHSVLIESILLYGSETWTLYGCYTKLLRYIKYNPDAEHHASNAEVYKNDVRPVSQALRERRLRFIGHCMRSNQPIADILLWDCDNHLEKEGGKRYGKRHYQDMLEAIIQRHKWML